MISLLGWHQCSRAGVPLVPARHAVAESRPQPAEAPEIV
jgi:hypothetical protein